MTRPSPVVVDTSKCPHARLRPVPLTSVRIADSFWAARRRVLRQVTLASQYEHLETTGRIDNFRQAAGVIDLPFQGYFFNDSDVYKWLEAAAWSLTDDLNPSLTASIDALIELIRAAQDSDGYLSTYFTHERASDRWANLRDMHELYCAGHLIQAAIAHHRLTGEDRLLDVARRLADLICDRFGPEEKGKQPGVPGHEGIEMALVELWRTTGKATYLDLARYFLDARGHGLLGGQPYHQDHRPFRELERMEGHAVRALYLNAGAADIYAETGDEALLRSLGRTWERMTERQMYLSGGVGSRHGGESFGEDYELPNRRAYAESCAAIANVFWNWRMLSLYGEARYADLLERALYNAALVGFGLDGQSYFYHNPLADDGRHRRQPWFACACCPPNFARLLASLPGYLYSLTPEGLWVHLYAAGELKASLLDGRPLGIKVETEYPWEGEVTISIATEGEFALHLRIPGWCEVGARVEVNGRLIEDDPIPGTYIALHRHWRRDDSVRLSLPMPVSRVEAHPQLAENAGRIALMRGPLLYCLEEVDHPDVDLDEIALADEALLDHEFEPGVLGGVVVLRAQAESEPLEAAWSNRLYRTLAPRHPMTKRRPQRLTAIPYYAWANREAGAMRVWIRRHHAG